jgi:protein phosphatase
VKIAILSDIHANLEALRSVTGSYDELWVLGDLVNYGPEPSEVVEFIRKNATLVISGNHDFAVGRGADPQCSPAFRAMSGAMQRYTESVLGEEQKAYLRQLPSSTRRDVGDRRFFLCHATPSDPLFRYGPAESSFWAEEIASVDADVVLVGHTHLPFILDIGTQRVVNPGSVGQPKHGRCEACYAVWEDGEITLRSRSYDVETTVAKLLALPIDKRIANQLAAVLREGSPPG